MTILRVKNNKFIKIKAKMVNKTSKKSKNSYDFVFTHLERKKTILREIFKHELRRLWSIIWKTVRTSKYWTIPLHFDGFLFYFMHFWGVLRIFPKGTMKLGAPLFSLSRTVVLRNTTHFLNGKCSAPLCPKGESVVV